MKIKMLKGKALGLDHMMEVKHGNEVKERDQSLVGGVQKIDSFNNKFKVGNGMSMEFQVETWELR